MKYRVYHGNFIYTASPNWFAAYPDSYLRVNECGVIEGMVLSPASSDELIELGEGLVIPAYTDLHLHSSQLPMMGLGCDGTVEEWFSNYCHPTEQAYAEMACADRVNEALTKELIRFGSLHAVIMSSVSAEATENLHQHLQRAGIGAFLGKMNSDFSESGPAEENTETSLRETTDLIEKFRKDPEIHYIISPEYIPTCSEELLDGLGELAKQNGLPVQSHMNEGEADTQAVAKRFPSEKSYAGVWEKYGLFGQNRTVMAHCTCTPEKDLLTMATKGIFLAYCPDAIVHIPSDRYLDVKKCMNLGIPLGLGSDVGGGHTLDMRQVLVNAVLVSKVNGHTGHLKLCEAFYLATKGGGAFFGNTGSFENGFYFDALVINDRELYQFRKYSMQERLTRYLYSGTPDMIEERYYHGSIVKFKEVV